MIQVRVNIPERGELDIPDFLETIREKFYDLVKQDGPMVPHVLKSFKPNECNCNSYETSKGHFLTPHYDDRALSGPVLMNLSLGCDSVMTYTAENGTEIEVELPTNTLQLVTGPSRWDYQHR